ncbi:CG4449, partial [Drosophila busckii]
ESKENDCEYDFIKANPSNVKQTAQSKAKAKPKAQHMNKNNVIQVEDAQLVETTTTKPAESPETPSRCLSPVSRLIHEMELKKQNEGPVARRTRRSLGKCQSSPVKPAEVIALTESPEAPQRRRGRKKAPPVAATAPTAVPAPLTSATRRQQMAEIAARANVLDSIDLISAVVPRVEGFVNLDSDMEDFSANSEPQATVASDDFESENPVMDINLTWMGEVQTYQLRKHQKFTHLFKEVAERNQVPLEDVVINMDEHFLKANESPESLKLKSYHMLSGYAMKTHKNKAQPAIPTITNLMIKPKRFQLKVQGDKWKRPLIIKMKPSETFKILYIKCSEEINCDVHDFKLLFDGELLELDDTPTNQDMEGNEMIDLRMK